MLLAIVRSPVARLVVAGVVSTKLRAALWDDGGR